MHTQCVRHTHVQLHTCLSACKLPGYALDTHVRPSADGTEPASQSHFSVVRLQCPDEQLYQFLHVCPKPHNLKQ